MNYIRPCDVKVRYDTFKDAEDALPGAREEHRAYYCSLCRGFHLTSYDPSGEGLPGVTS